MCINVNFINVDKYRQQTEKEVPVQTLQFVKIYLVIIWFFLEAHDIWQSPPIFEYLSVLN